MMVSWKTQLSQLIIFNRFHDSLPEFALQIVPCCLKRGKTALREENAYRFQTPPYISKAAADLRI